MDDITILWSTLAVWFFEKRFTSIRTFSRFVVSCCVIFTVSTFAGAMASTIVESRVTNWKKWIEYINNTETDACFFITMDWTRTYILHIHVHECTWMHFFQVVYMYVQVQKKRVQILKNNNWIYLLIYL